MNTADEVLRTAASLVSVDRDKTHGDMHRNMANIARLWNVFIYARENQRPLKGTDVATMLELTKIARRLTGNFNPDDYIDAAGYAAIAFEVSSNGEDVDYTQAKP